MPIRRLKGAIVGGGIGGLSAANAMLRRGIDVTVWEQVDPLSEVGTGLSLFPNSRRQLERMGLGEALAEVGAKVGEGSAFYRMDGTFVTRVVTADSSGWNGIYGMHRAGLLRVLAGALPSAAIRSGRRCIGFEQSAHSARLKFATGETDAVYARVLWLARLPGFDSEGKGSGMAKRGASDLDGRWEALHGLSSPEPPRPRSLARSGDCNAA
jgi:2-polyprenyl-6-methoxyphenol hydroxylase-like FAD-dependent oxidoreductase